MSITCRTPGCGATAPADERDRAYCEQCGWPLAEGRVDHEPSVLLCRNDTPQDLKLRLTNARVGQLRWEIVDMPAGVRALSQPLPAAPFSSSSVTLRVAPDQVAARDRLSLTVRVWDRVGRANYDLRTVPVGECYRDVSLEVPIRVQRYGPLGTSAKTLLFGGVVNSVPLSVRNLGEAEVRVRAIASAGYTVGVEGSPRAAELVLGGGQSGSLMVTRDPAMPTAEGSVSLEAPDLEPLRVALRPLNVRPPQPPKERYVIAVDFGTTKSAVVFLDQHRQNPQPKLVTWKARGMPEPQPWVQSVVAWSNDRPSEWGWQVSTIENGDHIVRRIKMRLREDDPRVQASIAFFIGRLLDQVSAEFGSEIFASARLVFSLPVLDQGDDYEEQRRRTLDAVLAAGQNRYGITAEQCSFYHEPECAAVDFVHHLFASAPSPADDKRLGMLRGSLQDGDWICVLDMGGGTTDISLGKLMRDSGGTPGFSEVRSLGFPDMAGDQVDEEIYRYCIACWLREGRVRTPVSATSQEEAVEQLSLLPNLELEGEGANRPVRRDDALMQLRVLKHQIFSRTPAVTAMWDPFRSERNYVTLDPVEIANHLRERMANRMFNEVRTHLDQWDLAPSAIKLLCLTGGTAQVPVFEEVLREKLQLSERETKTMVTPEFIRLNVARGAARRPAQRLSGSPLSIDLVCGTEVHRGALRRGLLPGATYKTTFHVFPGTSPRLEVCAGDSEGETVTLSGFELRNPDYMTRSLEVTLRYLPGNMLCIHAVWLTEPEEEAIPLTTIQTLPHFPS